jgi:type I restriction enzyme S subunit
MSLFNNSGGARRYYLQVAGGTSSSMKNVSRLQIQSLVIALPPFNEQNRIISKVDELMSLCDQLASRLGGAQTIQLHLADALTDMALARE